MKQLWSTSSSTTDWDGCILVVIAIVALYKMENLIGYTWLEISNEIFIFAPQGF